MDPLTIIGLLGNILTFIDYGHKALTTINSVYRSAKGASADNERLEEITHQLRSLAAKLETRKSEVDPEGTLKPLVQCAADCRQFCDEFLALLETLKAKRPGSKRYAVIASVKSLWKSGQKEEFAASIERYREQLNMTLSVVSSNEMRSQLAKLTESAAKSQGALDVLQTGVDAIRSTTAAIASSINPPGEAIVVDPKERLLDALSFTAYEERYKMVDDPYLKTSYLWLVWTSFENVYGHDNNNRDHDNNERLVVVDKLDAQMRLSRWLKSNKGSNARILHIIGKPGSGKSTFMKFLFQNGVAQHHLQEWSHMKKLIKSNFFFSKSSRHQELKSVDGMVRSLTLSMLRQAPGLVSVAFPEQCGQQHVPYQLDSDTINSAFQRLLKFLRFQHSYQVVWFIDALDEFDGPQDELQKLLNQLMDWNVQANGSLKICVSSREWTIFETQLSKSLQFRLQTLTRDEIMNYVIFRFAGNHGFCSLSSYEKRGLESAVGDGAEGVFLWARLVMDDLEDGLNCGLNYEALRQRADKLPRGLEGLFASLLSSIAKPDMRGFRYTLAMIQMTERHGITLPLFIFFYLDLYLSNKNFALDLPVHPTDGGDGDDKECWQIAQKRLFLQSHGIIEVRDVYHSGRLIWPPRRGCNMRVTLAHRSAAKYLASIVDMPDDEEVIDAMTQSYLALVKRTPSVYFSNGSDGCDDNSEIRFLNLLLSYPLANPTRRERQSATLDTITTCFRERGRVNYQYEKHPGWAEMPINNMLVVAAIAVSPSPLNVEYLEHLATKTQIDFRSVSQTSWFVDSWDKNIRKLNDVGAGGSPNLFAVQSIRCYIRILSMFIHGNNGEHADLLPGLIRLYVNCMDYWLLYADFKSNIMVIELLLRHGANINFDVCMDECRKMLPIKISAKPVDDGDTYAFELREPQSNFAAGMVLWEFCVLRGHRVSMADFLREIYLGLLTDHLKPVIDANVAGEKKTSWVGHTYQTCPECNGNWVDYWFQLIETEGDRCVDSELLSRRTWHSTDPYDEFA